MRNIPRCLILLLLVSLPLAACTQNASNPTTAGTSTETNNEALTVNYPSFSAAVYTNEISENMRGVNYNVPVMLGVSTTEPLKSFAIANIRITGAPQKGSVVVIAPKHNPSATACQDYYYNAYDCDDTTWTFPYGTAQDAGNRIDFAVQDTTEYADEIGRYGGQLKFSLLVEGIGTFDYQSTMDTYGLVKSDQIMKYAGINSNDISLSAEFDLLAVFEDGSEATKRYALTVGTGQLIETGWATGTLAEL